ncbi:hypothetical protein B0H14DRAFT_3515643 [Mycena olivaceomarginata]|nr:hypothetical protein B0H14DRAFT_3515643 [Mycena olivaceomarginata]
MSATKKWWPLGGTKGWTSDTGWGCMLCTSQSLLATAVGARGGSILQVLYTFPQPVGIAGGRALLIVLLCWCAGRWPLLSRSAPFAAVVPLRPFMGDPQPPLSAPASSHGHRTTSSHGHHSRRSLSPEAAAHGRGGSMSPESSGFARSGSMSPDFAYACGGSMSPDWGRQTSMTEDKLTLVRLTQLARQGGLRACGSMSAAEEGHFAVQDAAEWARLSMLIGFMVRDEVEWVDLRRRIKELPHTIFAIADELSTWPGTDDNDDMGLESISDPEEVEEISDDDKQAIWPCLESCLCWDSCAIPG